VRDLTDKVAVVTGAGSGIGRALALELARRECHLALTDRTATAVAPVAEQIARLGRRVSVHAFDVAERDAWPGFVEDLVAAHGHLDLVVNNAGVALTGPFLACSLDDLQWQLDVNLWGVIHGCHFLLPLLLARPEGHLVNVSSLFGIISPPDHAGYVMSKHAVRALTEVLEVELWKTNVRLTSVHPGAVATRIAADARFRQGGVSHERAASLIARGIPPEQAARRIADGIVADERQILVGRDARLFATLQRLLPVRYRDLMVWFGSRIAPR
jgi:NADP-dependent 3-hydroxy acid dehydrogenase YdfG